MPQSVAEQVFAVIKQHTTIHITSHLRPHQIVDFTELKQQLQLIEDQDLHLNFSDYNTTITYLAKGQMGLNKSKKNNTNQFSIRELLTITILIKIGVLHHSLELTPASYQIVNSLNQLNNLLIFETATNIKNNTRKRASLHRANLQLNKKRHTNDKKTIPVNCLAQFIQDIHIWEQKISSYFYHKIAGQFDDQLININSIINTLIMLHHQWQLLLENHLKRSEVYLSYQIKQQQCAFKNQEIHQQQIHQYLQLFKDRTQAFEQQSQQKNNQINQQLSYKNYLINRCHLQLFLSQLDRSETITNLLTNRVFTLYEPNLSLADQLCHMLQFHQRLIELFWYEVYHLSQSICQLDEHQYHQQILDWFCLAQHFKNHLISLNIHIEKLANQLPISTKNTPLILADTQSYLLSFINKYQKIFSNKQATVGKVTTHHSAQGLFAQLTQIEISPTLAEILLSFDTIIAALCYQQHQALNQNTLYKVQRAVKINIETLNQFMNNGYNDWLQLINMLRHGDHEQNTPPPRQLVLQPLQDTLHAACRLAIQELIEFGPLPFAPSTTTARDHQSIQSILPIIACLDSHWLTESDKLKPAYLDMGNNTLDKLLKVLHQYQIKIPVNSLQWLELMLPLLNFETALFTLIKQPDPHHNRPRNSVIQQHIIYLTLDQASQLDDLILQAIHPKQPTSIDSKVLHYPSHLVISIQSGQRYLTLNKQLKLVDNNYHLSAILTKDDQNIKSWVKHQHRWYQYSANQFHTTRIEDHLRKLSANTQVLIYSCDH